MTTTTKGFRGALFAAALFAISSHVTATPIQLHYSGVFNWQLNNFGQPPLASSALDNVTSGTPFTLEINYDPSTIAYSHSFSESNSCGMTGQQAPATRTYYSWRDSSSWMKFNYSSTTLQSSQYFLIGTCNDAGSNAFGDIWVNGYMPIAGTQRGYYFSFSIRDLGGFSAAPLPGQPYISTPPTPSHGPVSLNDLPFLEPSTIQNRGLFFGISLTDNYQSLYASSISKQAPASIPEPTAIHLLLLGLGLSVASMRAYRRNK